jgi:hypothetical protein
MPRYDQHPPLAVLPGGDPVIRDAVYMGDVVVMMAEPRRKQRTRAVAA